MEIMVKYAAILPPQCIYCSFEAYSSGVVPHSFPQKQWFYCPALHPEIGEWRKRGSGARSTAKLERHARLKCFTVLERQDTVCCRAKMVYCGAKARSTAAIVYCDGKARPLLHC